MTNLQSVEQDRVVAGNIFAMLDNANSGVNIMKFISLATVMEFGFNCTVILASLQQIACNKLHT